MDDKPLYFILDKQPKLGFLFVAVGAIGGFVAYLVNQRVRSNMLISINGRIARNYHPNLMSVKRSTVQEYNHNLVK